MELYDLLIRYLELASPYQKKTNEAILLYDKIMVLIMKTKKIIYFTADWCSACKAMKPNFEKVMSNLPDIKYEYIDVESDRGNELSLIYSIKNLPTLIFLDEKGDIIGRETGNTAFKEIDKYL